MLVLRCNWLSISLCLLALLAPVAWGQQQQNQGQNTAPIPAYNSPLGSTESTTENDQGSFTPDTHALAGAEYLSLGSLETSHSYWQPYFSVFATADSNPYEGPTTQSNWYTWTSFSGGVNIHRISGISEMTLGYTGGAMYSNDGSVATGDVQGLDFSDTLSFRRSKISFLDQLSYLPEAAYGFGGISGVSLPGGTSPGIGSGLGPGFLPGQTILTGYGQNVMNSFVTEVDTQVTPRSSLTFAGGYSLLDYFGGSYIDSGQVAASVGYNYQISEKNTIAVLYAFDQYRFTSSIPTIYNHTAQIAYARRVTGRLAFQVAGGPDEFISSGSRVLDWSLNSSLQYQYQRTQLGLTYYHWVTGGSGVLPGALSDTAGGSITRKMSRTFSSGITAGYSHNHWLTIGTAPSNGTYNYWYAGASFSEPLGPSLGLTFSYQMQYQDSNASFCIGTTCGSNLIQHLISVGMSWKSQPLRF